ncbi:MAG: AI-2E family transporter [Anaerolineae bacterium]
MNYYPPTLTSAPWTARTKRMVALGVLALAVFALLRLSDILPIIGVAIILAYLLTPLVSFIERRILVLIPFARKFHRGLAVGLTYVIILAAIVVLIVVVVPVLVGQVEEFGKRIPNLLQSVEQSLEISLSQPLTFNGEPILINGEPFIPLQRLRDATGIIHLSDIIQLGDFNAFSTTQSFIGSLTGPAFDFVGGALTAIINLIFLLSMMFFLMRDGTLFVEKGVQLLPMNYRGDARRLLYELGQVWNAYLRGQLTLAFFMGTVVFTIATILGLPNPIILAMISALLEFIPGIGSGLAIFPAALLALTSKSTTFPFIESGVLALIVIFIWALLQNIEAYILVPRIMGGSLNLHPFVVVIGIIAGASLAGVLGIILAAPAVASLRIFGQYIYGKLMNHDPFPSVVIHKNNKSPFVGWLRRRGADLQEGWETHIGPQLRQGRSARRN